MKPKFKNNPIFKLMNFHVVRITILVFVIMKLGSMVPINFNALNPFKKGSTDYEVTDIVFSEFKKNDVEFDDRIVLVNVGAPDRKEIIELIKVIESYEPKVVGVDIHFEELKDSSTDSLLRNTIRSYDNIILSQKLNEYDAQSGTYQNLNGCHPYFCDSVMTAYTNFYGSANVIIRKFSPYEFIGDDEIMGLGSATAIQFDPSKNKTLSSRSAEEYINYIGDKDAFVNLSKDQILNRTSDLSEVFKGKLVMLGYLGDSNKIDSAMDKFVTPMNSKITAKTDPDMYGLSIHANIAHMILEGKYINHLSNKLTFVINFLMIFFTVLVFNKVYNRVNSGYWKIIKVLQMCLFAILFLMVSTVFYFFDLKLQLGVGIVGAVLSWDAVKWYNNLYIKRQSFFKPKTTK